MCQVCGFSDSWPSAITRQLSRKSPMTQGEELMYDVDLSHLLPKQKLLQIQETPKHFLMETALETENFGAFTEC